MKGIKNYNFIKSELYVAGLVIGMLLFLSSIISASTKIGTDIGNSLVTDISTYINGFQIPSYNIDGYTVVMCNHLSNYGFNVAWDSEQRIVRIAYDKNKKVTPMEIENNGLEELYVGTKTGDVLYTDISVYVDNRKIPSYNIDGYTAIATSDLAAFGNVSWDSGNRIVKINANKDYTNNIAVRLNNNSITNNYFDDTKYFIIENVYYNLETQSYEIEENSIYISEYPTYGGKSVKGETKKITITEYPTKLLIGTVVKSIDRYVTSDASEKMINENYERDLEYYQSPYLLQFALNLEALNPTKYSSLEDEFKKNDYVPLKCKETRITYNSIGIPEVTLTLKNLTAKEIKALELSFQCYDDFGRRVNRYLSKTNTFNGISQNLFLESGESTSLTWTLNLYDFTTNINGLSINRVSYSDGTTWSK